MKPQRRPFLLEPGESLLVTSDPIKSLTNHVGAANAIGIRQDQLVASRMCPMPLPLRGARPETPTSQRKRIDGVCAEWMWLPMLWLPRRLRERLSFQFVDGDVIVVDNRGLFEFDPCVVSEPVAGIAVNIETVDLWAIRVALELEALGAYDVESGTWLDVLSLVGIDVERGGTLPIDRVRRWLDGSRDVELDHLNASFMEGPSSVPEGEDPTWALRAALSTYRDLLDATWALGTSSMLDVVGEMKHDVDDGSIDDADEAKFIANMVCMLAGPLLRFYTDSEFDWWQQMSRAVESFVGTPRDLVQGPLRQIDDRLLEVHESTWPRMESAANRYRS